MTFVMQSVSSSGARIKRVSGFCRMSSANGRGASHIPGGRFCIPLSSNLSFPGNKAAMTGVAFLLGTNQVSPILSSFKSFCCKAEKTLVEPT